MRRTTKITANGYSARVAITIKIDTSVGHLVRDEVETMVDNLASDIMAVLPNVRHLNVPLSRVRVS